MRKNDRQAGGVFIALGAIAGVVIGKLQGQTSLGLIAGVAVGAVVALVIWRRTR